MKSSCPVPNNNFGQKFIESLKKIKTDQVNEKTFHKIWTQIRTEGTKPWRTSNIIPNWSKHIAMNKIKQTLQK